MACIERGHIGSSRQSADRRTRPGTHAFIRIHGWSALEFLGQGQIHIGQVKAKEWGFEKNGVDLSQESIRHIGTGKLGETVTTGLLGNLYRELNICCDSVDCYLGHVLACEEQCQFKSLQAAWPNKMDAEAAIP